MKVFFLLGRDKLMRLCSSCMKGEDYFACCERCVIGESCMRVENSVVTWQRIDVGFVSAGPKRGLANGERSQEQDRKRRKGKHAC